MDLILYHNSCPDGFCAAYIAQKRWPDATVLPCDHGLEPPYALVEGKDVLVVDFSWRTREQNEKTASLAKSFYILDHHKSAKEVLDGLPFATFDMNRSGAGLAWDYLYGVDRDKIKFTPDQPVVFKPMADALGWRPWFVDYVEDRDLWRHRLPNTRAVNAYIMACEHDFCVWDNMIAAITPEKAAEYGAGSLRHIEHYVREGVKQAQTGELIFVDSDGFVHEYRVLVVNALYLNISELCGELAEKGAADLAIGWFERGDGLMQFSLRSRGDVDVSKLAQAKNGGGHAGAAGFQLSITEGRALIDAVLGRTNRDEKIFYALKNKLDK